MTSKTKRTMALIDQMTGVPHLLEGRPTVVVPRKAWCFYELRQPLDFRGWWQTSRGKYDSGLMFRLSDDL
jgi:hypothetical protein